MPIMFTHPDCDQFDIEDLPLSVYAEIEAETGVTWFNLASAPFRYAKAGEMLIRRCAAVKGVKVDEEITPKSFINYFEVVDEPNQPVEWTDGMPDPLSEGPDSGTVG